MSKDDLRHWGVPELAPFIRSHRSVNSFSWPSYVYTVIREWQVARGFDPGTADFARSLGYPEFEILGSGKDEDFEIIDTSETKALEDAEWEVMS
ncbi:hypothetical protein VNI00_004637 [Paramarasmius palmivorus]|uniref:Uncharacterized protein n=1 Tax=Paramarasmius palmivorus TaxID=297713 RepID=A0AAW0DFH8_9AGAR